MWDKLFPFINSLSWWRSNTSITWCSSKVLIEKTALENFLLLVKYKSIFVSIKVSGPFIVSFCWGTVIKFLDCNQGRGRRLLKFSYLDHPTKSDVTSGLNWAALLVSQSEKMAFRFAKTFFYLQPIRFVSFQTEGRKMLQVHSFDSESKTFGKRQHFIMVLKENNWEPSVIEWRILHICETDVLPTFGSCSSWLSDNTKWNSA